LKNRVDTPQTHPTGGQEADTHRQSPVPAAPPPPPQTEGNKRAGCGELSTTAVLKS
ncbi:hypothetical protein STEG23_010016, partial [Scotinomys teguina]